MSWLAFTIEPTACATTNAVELAYIVNPTPSDSSAFVFTPNLDTSGNLVISSNDPTLGSASPITYTVTIHVKDSG